MTPETLKPTDLIAPQPPVASAETSEPTPPPAAENEAAAIPPEPTPEPERDAAGVPYDPERHVSAKHPRTGRWMPRRRSVADTAESGPSFVAPDEPAAASTAADGQPAPVGPDVCDAMADLHCQAFYGITVALISDEWLPSRAEHESNKRILAAYYRAKGITPDKPGMALLAQVTAFAGKRLGMPKTQTRLGAVKAWISAKWLAWQGARRADRLHSVTQ